MKCNGRCTAYQALKHPHRSRYLSGHKRCQVCDIFILWEGVKCPCCHYSLRVKPRRNKLREQYHKAIGIVRL